MAFQSYCYLRQGFIIALQQMSVSKWHQLTNYKSPRLIWHRAGSDWGLPHISAIPKTPKHFSQQQENGPFGATLLFFMKWLRFANKGLLGQLNSVCAWSVQEDTEMGHRRCLWHCASIVCACIRAVKRGAVPVDKTFPIFPDPIGSKRVCLIDSGVWFFSFLLRKKWQSSMLNKGCLGLPREWLRGMSWRSITSRDNTRKRLWMYVRL